MADDPIDLCHVWNVLLVTTMQTMTPQVAISSDAVPIAAGSCSSPPPWMFSIGMAEAQLVASF